MFLHVRQNQCPVFWRQDVYYSRSNV